MSRQVPPGTEPAGVTLVTGGVGFPRSYVAEHLIVSGRKVVVLDDLSGGYRDNVPPGARLVIGSILDREPLRSLFCEEKFIHVYHFAAYATERLSHKTRIFTHTNNVVGTPNLIIEALRANVRAFVFAPTAGVCGPSDEILNEDAVPRPEDPCGIAKFATELDLQAAFRLFGMPYAVFRLHNVHSEMQDLSDAYRNVVGIHMRQALQGHPMAVVDDGLQTRHSTQVVEVVPRMVRPDRLREALGQIFNLGGARAHTVPVLSRMVARAVGVEWRVKHELPSAEVHTPRIGHSWVRRILRFSPETSLYAGLDKMARWAEENIREALPFRSVDLDNYLPTVWRNS